MHKNLDYNQRYRYIDSTIQEDLKYFNAGKGLEEEDKERIKLKQTLRENAKLLIEREKGDNKAYKQMLARREFKEKEREIYRQITERSR